MEESSEMALDTQTKQKADAKQKIESKPIVENKTEAEAPKKSPKSLILIGSIVLIAALGSAGFFAFRYYKGKSNPESGQKAGQTSKKEEVKATLALDPFLVNLADKEESRFVKTTFQLGLAEEMKEESKTSVPAMRDSIITLLSLKTADQLLTAQGKDKLREEIRSRVNAISPKIRVLEVYIVEFVVQL
jgi:flagellar protein FliL